MRHGPTSVAASLLGLACATSWACGSSQPAYQGFSDGGASSGSGGGGSSSSGSGGGGSGSSSGGLVNGDGSTSGGPPGCAAEAQYVYVVDVNGVMYKFDPPTLAFTQVGTVSCASSSMFSMAVDRNAVAWVLAQDGTIVRYDINAKTCTPTTFAANQHGFTTFGMGFSANAPNSTAETLFVTDDELTNPTAGQGLATIDVSTLSLTPVHQYDQLVGQTAEMTGTGDARLFAAFEGNPYTVAEIDKSTAHIISVAPQTAISYPVSTSLAFAAWGGDFWLFVGPGGTTDVWQYQPSMKTTTKRATEPFEIVGAGVSTCAPTTPTQ
jgi:hypothetical protein